MRLIRILLMVVLAVVVGLVALLVFLPGEKIAKIAADQVKAQTGRELVFEGDVGISWYPILGVATGPVSFANADWSEGGPMFTAKSAAIGVDAMSLIGGDIRITKIEMQAPDVLLEVSKDGKANWDLFPEVASDSSAAPSESAGLGGLVLESLSVSDARLRYVDHGGESLEIQDVDAVLKWPDRSGPAEVDLSLKPASETVTLAAEIADLEGFLGGAVSSVTASVKAADGEIGFDGRAGMDPQAGGQLEVNLPDADGFMEALGLEAAGLSGRTTFSGSVTYTKDGKITVREGSLAAMGNSLSVEADVVTGGARPVVNARIGAGALSLAAFMGGESESGSTAGWSKAAIDASGLGAIDGEIALSASSIDLGTLAVGKTSAVVKIEDSRAVITLSEMAAFDGVASGTVVANARSGLSASADLTMSSFTISKLLSETAGISRFEGGEGNAKIKVLTSGGSMHAMMNALSGSGSLDIGQGKITGFDLDKLLRGQTGGGTTVFNTLTASWSIKNGVLSNDDLLMELTNVLAKGEGTVGIGPRTIDYLFTPQLRSETDDGLAVPVEIKGSWDSPSIIPRLDKAFGKDAEEEVDAAIDSATDKLKEKLGVTTEEGQSSEDALKQKLEDKAKDKLKKLLGGD